MQIVFQCPGCDTTNYRHVNAASHSLDCSDCDWTRIIPEADLKDETPQCCLACSNSDLWRQKDFPQGLGLLMVVAGATLSTIAWWKMEPAIAIGILLVFAAIDMLLYVVMPDVLVCYRCRSRHRKANIAEEHPRFNLELHERYRQEEIRLAESNQNQSGNS